MNKVEQAAKIQALVEELLTCKAKLSRQRARSVKEPIIHFASGFIHIAEAALVDLFNAAVSEDTIGKLTTMLESATFSNKANEAAIAKNPKAWDRNIRRGQNDCFRVIIRHLKPSLSQGV